MQFLLPALQSHWGRFHIRGSFAGPDGQRVRHWDRSSRDSTFGRRDHRVDQTEDAIRGRINLIKGELLLRQTAANSARRACFKQALESCARPERQVVGAAGGNEFESAVADARESGKRLGNFSEKSMAGSLKALTPPT